MKARDIMTAHVISVGPDATVDAVANTLVSNGISAVPVIDIGCHLVGIVSEGDLLRRSELDTQVRRPWWLAFLTSDATLAAEFSKSRAVKANDIMTREVLTVTPETPVADIARLLEKHGIKRVPVVENGVVVGVVSRANLVQALASARHRDFDVDRSDQAVRERILEAIANTPWRNRPFNIIVQDGAVELWGCVYSQDERQALRVAAEAAPGVTSVKDNLRVLPTIIGI